MCVSENPDLESHLQEMRISCTLMLKCTLNILLLHPCGAGVRTSRITPIPISSILRVCCSASEGKVVLKYPQHCPRIKGEYLINNVMNTFVE